MADHRRQVEDGVRRHERDWIDRGDDNRSWFDDRNSRYETDRGPSDVTSLDRYRSSGLNDRYTPTAANEYSRAAREQRDDLQRWSAHNPEDWGVQHVPGRYEAQRPSFQGRGPKGYQRSDARIREEICDCMTEDPMLDASEIEVEVKQGEVLLSGSVTSRDQKRRAEDVAERIGGVRDVTNQLRVMRDTTGHNWADGSSRASDPGKSVSSQPVAQASGNGTPSKTTSGTSA